MFTEKVSLAEFNGQLNRDWTNLTGFFLIPSSLQIFQDCFYEELPGFCLVNLSLIKLSKLSSSPPALVIFSRFPVIMASPVADENEEKKKGTQRYKPGMALNPLSREENPC